MSDTPETDASCGYALSSHCGRLEGSYLQMDWSGPFVHAEVARKLERERDEAEKKLSSIHRWIERNHADGFIDSLTYLQNLERVVDCWYDRIDAIESDARRYLRESDEARELHRKALIEREATEKEVDAMLERSLKAERERDEAREENKKLKGALIRVRTWGIFSKKFSATDSCNMSEWIDDGCEGELPKPNGPCPWI